MSVRQIQRSNEIYGVQEWGGGYFSINDEGNVTAHPTGDEHVGVDLMQVMDACRQRRVDFPAILRFPQIVKTQMQRLHNAFKEAIWEFNYTGGHLGVFPFKVNQRREFIDQIVECGREMHYGLEVGSKTEFMAALSYDLSEKALLICNGFKDYEFVDMAFAAAAMQRNVILVVEGPDELELIIEKARGRPKTCPQIGLRVRLYSKGSGKWSQSSGEKSKFGLTTIELLKCLKILENSELKDHLSMLHFHIGSQITEIKRFKNAIKEASRVYSKTVKMGYTPRFLNIGGGVGVDYDGSRTTCQTSANYTLQEFANDAVYVIGDVCSNEGVPAPQIVTESGRVIAAYHSVVVTNIREVQAQENLIPPEELGLDLNETTSHKGINELKYILDNLNRKNFVEFYHDAVEYHEELFTLFSLGYLKLTDRAVAEELFYRICRKALYFASQQRHQLEEFEELQSIMVNKYLANFSIFQSIPDAWSIDHLFPVAPLSRHNENPSLKGTIVDITCDSDGCLERFVDRREVKEVLELHTPNDQPYYLGFFLVGAYQESLANEHNLFGAINEVEVNVDSSGRWSITKVTPGDPIEELLTYRNYNMDEMVGQYQVQVQRCTDLGTMTQEAGRELLENLRTWLRSYPYLLDDECKVATEQDET